MNIDDIQLPPRPHRPQDEQLVPLAAPYRFRQDLLPDLALAIRLDANVLLVGPPGTGKTSLPVQIAAAKRQPCIRFNCDGETRVHHLRGQQRPAAVDGVLTLAFHHGRLVEAMRAGHWVVFDELDAAPANVLFALQPVLEEGSRTIDIPETGETVAAHPAFRVFATGNTIGARSRARAKHAGTSPMNTALVDRFSMLIEVTYPSREEENEIVSLHAPGLDGEGGRLIIEGMCRVAEKLRGSGIDFSMRRTIQWAKITSHYPIANAKQTRDLPWDVLRAAKLTILRKFENPADAKTAYELICRTFQYPATTSTAGV